MGWATNQALTVLGTRYGAGEVLPDKTPEGYLQVLRDRNWVTEVGDDGQPLEASGATSEPASGAQADEGTPAPTPATEDAQDASEASSSSDEYPKRTTPDSSWYELSNGEKVQGYDAAVEEEQALHE